MRVTVRRMLLLTLLAALNLAAGLATSRSYPRPKAIPLKYGSRNVMIEFFEDGSAIAHRTGRRGMLGPPTDPRVIKPPRPTLARIWSPVLMSATISALALLVAWKGPGRPRMSARRWAAAAAGSALAIWLAVPLALIAGNTREDYHIHQCRGVPGGQSVHATLFWPRYGYLLRGRPWPDDYICPIPHEVSLAPPH
jgi:hypothetical protein